MICCGFGSRKKSLELLIRISREGCLYSTDSWDKDRKVLHPHFLASACRTHPLARIHHSRQAFNCLTNYHLHPQANVVALMSPQSQWGWILCFSRAFGEMLLSNRPWVTCTCTVDWSRFLCWYPLIDSCFQLSFYEWPNNDYLGNSGVRTDNYRPLYMLILGYLYAVRILLTAISMVRSLLRERAMHTDLCSNSKRLIWNTCSYSTISEAIIPYEAYRVWGKALWRDKPIDTLGNAWKSVQQYNLCRAISVYKVIIYKYTFNNISNIWICKYVYSYSKDAMTLPMWIANSMGS